jgi:hypothetical protein
MIYWFVLFATIILFPAIAEAQVQTGTTLPPLLIPLEPPETFPPSGTQGGYLFNLRPLGSDFGQTLADHGIYTPTLGEPEKAPCESVLPRF